jgi:LruC domain-containing protein
LNNLPWAINIVSEFVWPLEKVSIVEAYKHFFDWAKSAGAEFGDWYEDKTGYREPTKLYTVE